MKLPYPSYGAMLTPAQMRQTAKRYEDTPCTWLWSECTSTGFNLLTRLLHFLSGINEYLQNCPAQADMTEALRPFGMSDFEPAPSQATIIGLAIVWGDVCALLNADSRFGSLMGEERRPLDANWRFIPIRAGLVQLHDALSRHSRTNEAYYWLQQIGWDELLELADRRDHASRELMAGRAFCEPEGGIAILPTSGQNNAAA
jgi:hypothetical protein